MTAEEMQDWLETDTSKKAGWKKDGDSGESVGHER